MSAIILYRTDLVKNMRRFYPARPGSAIYRDDPESQKMAMYPAVEPAHRLFRLWPWRSARGSGGRNNRNGIRMWNRSRLHYLRVHAFRWLDDTTAFIQFLA